MKVALPITPNMNFGDVVKRWKSLGVEDAEANLRQLVEKWVIKTKSGCLAYVKSDVVELIESNFIFDQTYLARPPFNLASSYMKDEPDKTEKLLERAGCENKEVVKKYPIISELTEINVESLKDFEQQCLDIDHGLDLTKKERAISSQKLNASSDEAPSETAIKAIGLLMEVLADSKTYRNNGGDPSLNGIKDKLLDRAQALGIDSTGLAKAHDTSKNGILTKARDYIEKHRTDRNK